MLRPRWQWRNLAFDVGPVVVLLVLGEIDVLVQLSVPFGAGPRWTAAATVIVCCLLLVVRRRWPLLTLALVMAAVVLPGMVGPTRITYWGEYVPWLVAMYSAGRHLPRRRATWGPVLTVAGYGLLMVVQPAMREVGDIVYNLVLLVAAWALGLFAASWARYRARTLLLEFERGQAEERARTRERARIARELHDVISHTMAVIVLQAGGARLAATTDPAAPSAALRNIERLGRECTVELRTLLEVLRSDDPESAGTAPQPVLADLGRLCAQMESLGLRIEMVGPPAHDALPHGLQLTGYRIVQEGLTNVLRHAGAVATEVLVDQVGDGELIIQVSNAPGRGGARLTGAGRGLAGLRERVAAAGGTLRAGSRADGGFVLHASLPLTQRVPW